MKDTANNTERKYTFVEKLADKPETDKQLEALNEELDRTKKCGAIAIAATTVVGIASTITVGIIVKKKLEPKYMTLGQIINLGKYAEYKKLVAELDTAITTENEKKIAAEKPEATKAQKEAATEATKQRKEAEDKLEDFMRVDKKDKKDKKDNKKKNKNENKGKKNSDGEDDE